MSTNVRRARAVLKYGSKLKFLAILTLARAIYAKMSSNAAAYPSPSPTLAALLAAITALSNAQDAVAQRQPGAVTVRAAARDSLLTILEGLRVFVQTLADSATPEQSAVLIDGAGMKVAAVTPRARPVLGLKLGVAQGTVLLVAAASLLSKSKRMKTYGWEFSIDGQKTWQAAPSTPIARTTIAGLPSLTTVAFRVNVTDAVSVTEWSQAVTTLVH